MDRFLFGEAPSVELHVHAMVGARDGVQQIPNFPVSPVQPNSFPINPPSQFPGSSFPANSSQNPPRTETSNVDRIPVGNNFSHLPPPRPNSTAISTQTTSQDIGIGPVTTSNFAVQTSSRCQTPKNPFEQASQILQNDEIEEVREFSDDSDLFDHSDNLISIESNKNAKTIANAERESRSTNTSGVFSNIKPSNKGRKSSASQTKESFGTLKFNSKRCSDQLTTCHQITPLTPQLSQHNGRRELKLPSSVKNIGNTLNRCTTEFTSEYTSPHYSSISTNPNTRTTKALKLGKTNTQAQTYNPQNIYRKSSKKALTCSTSPSMPPPLSLSSTSTHANTLNMQHMPNMPHSLTQTHAHQVQMYAHSNTTPFPPHRHTQQHIFTSNSNSNTNTNTNTNTTTSTNVVTNNNLNVNVNVNKYKKNEDGSRTNNVGVNMSVIDPAFGSVTKTKTHTFIRDRDYSHAKKRNKQSKPLTKASSSCLVRKDQKKRK
jgi:hypothetical protein